MPMTLAIAKARKWVQVRRYIYQPPIHLIYIIAIIEGILPLYNPANL